MYRHEEDQYQSQQWISQEQPEPRPVVQILAALAFIGFIIAIPVIVDRLGK